MKLIEYISAVINLDVKTLSNDAKLVLIFMIAAADPAGVVRIDKTKYLETFGKRYSKSWIQNQLGFWIQYLDKDRVLIPNYLKYRYGSQLQNIDNPRYNVLNRLRCAIKKNQLSFDIEKMELQSQDLFQN